MSDETSSRTAYQESVNASTTCSAPNSSAASSHVSVPSDKAAWIAFAVLLVVALIVIVREESRATRAEDRAQHAMEELTAAKRDQATELQLRRYNLDWFRAHEHAELEVRVGVLERICKR